MTFRSGAAAGGTKRRGMGDAAAVLRRPTSSTSAGPTGSLVAALGADRAATSGTDEILRRLPVSEIAPHPDNPRFEINDLIGIAESIRLKGLKQPIVVVPRDVFLAANPDLQVPDHARWIVTAGHRRLAAAQLAGVDELISWVRPDQGERRHAAETFIIENLHRKGLSPLEEARSFSLMADLGETQRDIAGIAGVSQAYVSKRRSLLKLPQEIQTALIEETLAVGEALALSQVPPEDQLPAFKLARRRAIPVVSAIREVERDRLVAQGRAEARVRADRESIPFLEDSASEAEGLVLLHQAAEVKAAKAAGTLCATSDHQGKFVYASSAPTARISSDSVSDDDRERKLAAKARAGAAAQLVSSRKPTPREVTDALVRTVLDNGLAHGEALRLVHAWLGDSVGIKDENRHSWLSGVTAGERSTQGWVAWAMTIASTEVRARSKAAWDRDVADYIGLLGSEVGYQPTPWELHQLASIPTSGAVDSAGINASPAASEAGV